MSQGDGFLERVTAHDEMQLRMLASTQHGVVRLRQALGLGIDRPQVRYLVRTGRWERVGAHAIALVGAPPSDLHASVRVIYGLGDAAVLSHDSAASFWGLTRFTARPVHVTVPHGRNPATIPGAVLHQSRRTPSRHVVEIDGLRVTTPARTVFDLSGTLRPAWRVEATLDDAWAAGLVNRASMSAVVDAMSGRGQRNVAELRSLLEARTDQDLADSALERRFHRIVSDSGLPPLERQVHIVDDEGWWGRVDAVYRDALVIVEIDGDRWHSALSHRRRDQDRRRRHESMGYTVLRFRENDVWHRPHLVTDELRRARTDGLTSQGRAA
jgi:very-short-patch-repair endonuclease